MFLIRHIVTDANLSPVIPYKKKSIYYIIFYTVSYFQINNHIYLKKIKSTYLGHIEISTPYSCELLSCPLKVDKKHVLYYR